MPAGTSVVRALVNDHRWGTTIHMEGLGRQPVCRRDIHISEEFDSLAEAIAARPRGYTLCKSCQWHLN
jgi:hypothetical protein